MFLQSVVTLIVSRGNNKYEKHRVDSLDRKEYTVFSIRGYRKFSKLEKNKNGDVI